MNCFITGCPARVVVLDNICSRPSGEHNHLSQSAKMAAIELKNRIKTRCVSENRSVRAIFDQEVAK